MAIHIRDAEAERLIRELARCTGETMTGAVVVAVRDRLARQERKAADIEVILEESRAIARHFNSLPVLDSRSLEEMLYDEHGLPA
jgi:antitoxin VapB